MRRLILFVSMLLLVSLTALPAAQANDDPSEELQDAVKVERIRTHQKKFQDVADANDGTRVSGTGGYDDSVAYVVKKLEQAGYDVEIDEFEFDFFQVIGAPGFEQATPAATTYVDGTDFDVMTFSGSGTTGTVDFVGVDLSLGDPSLSTSGCEVADFAAFPAGSIAVMQRGACFFSTKAANAEAAGAVGAVVFNQGTPGREGLYFGTLGGPGINIPVVSSTFAIGVDLATVPGGATGSLDVTTVSEVRTTSNVIAQTKTGDPDNVVFLGAHLDSVPEGPGIQDNGSGSAAILEIALQLEKRFKVNKTDGEGTDRGLVNAVRFGWWGAEESGLIGSIDYAVSLTQAELDQIQVYLNFDMIGSPNFVRFVYDGDGSDVPPTISVPPESADVEQVFLDHFAGEGLATEATVIGQRSDHFAFCVLGIPCGGLFTGAEGIKTPAQEAVYGGTAGDQYDPCYHLACDTFDNISLTALDQMSNAAAHAAAWYAFDLAP